MMFWDKLSESHAWRTSLLLKTGTLGIGIIVVLLAGWPQPQIGNLDHSSVPIMLSENTRIQEVPRESISVPVISPKVDLASSSIEKEG